ncbi:MAG: leucine-rich repeat domain-containing protein [Wolbachia endosymbiont of Menacanthus eurysternus]|nr:leucine-rich repeat domain-containing protein [Wolbachia endosymbiont of Menacanthus eurysternus]
MNFSEYVNDNVLYLSGQLELKIDQLIKFLQRKTNIEHLCLSNCKIDDQGAEALAKSENLKNLTSLNLSENNIGDEGAKVLIKALNDGKFPDLDFLDLKNKDISTGIEKKLYNALEFNIKHADHIRTNKSKLPIITACAGLLLGLGVAYFAGAATLTPVGAAVAVFTAAVVVGVLIGYGLGKFCEKVSEKKQKDPDMSTWGAVKSVFSDVFTAGHSKQQELQA